MSIIAFVCATAGAMLIGVALYDIVATVLHPQVESPVSNRFHRLGWGLLRLVAGRVRAPEARHRLLGWGLPLLIAGLIALWFLLLLTGFALLYYPWLGDPARFDTPEGATGSLLEALYFSGTSLSTVGYGDFQAIQPIFRGLAIAEAASGFVVISLSVAYLLAVYPAVSRVQSLAVALDAEVAGQPGALPLVRRYLATEGGWDGAFADRLRELALALLDVTGVHGTHPVLYYSHPCRPHHSFLRVLVTAQGIIGRCRYGLSPDRHGGIVRNPQLVLLEQSLLFALRRLSASLHIPDVEREESVPGRAELAGQFAHLCRELEEIGLVSARSLASAPVPAIVDSSSDDPDRPGDDAPGGAGRASREDGAGVGDPAYDQTAPTPLDAYVTFRHQTDPHLVAYAIACGYAIEEARRDRALA